MSSVDVRLQSQLPKIKPMHGVNNGPVCYGGCIDVSHLYRDISIPWVRLHDPNWPHPREVDIPQIFPDFDADPDDPNSYDFRRTDTYLQSVLQTGARIVYRLGVSIEHTPIKYFTKPPKDFQKWADICAHVIRHYNQEWADGFQYGITHWEIWNEPDIGALMWDGSFEQYLELYKVAATTIKHCDASVKVGGYAAADPGSDKVRQFMAFCRDEKLPLDFMSWHAYTSATSLIEQCAGIIRRLLDEHGFSQAESHLNEWNLMTPEDWAVWTPGAENFRRSVFERQKGAVGASFVAAVLTVLQDAPVDVANYYDGQPSALFCGLFDYYGVPQKSWYAMKAFSELLKYPYRAAVDVHAEQEGIFALAAYDPSCATAAVLVSNYECSDSICNICVEGLQQGNKQRGIVRLIDDNNSLDIAAEAQLSSSMQHLEIDLPMHSVALLTIDS